MTEVPEVETSVRDLRRTKDWTTRHASRPADWWPQHACLPHMPGIVAKMIRY
jgi:hypothetical protein